MTHIAKRLLNPQPPNRDEYWRDVVMLLRGEGDNGANNVATADSSGNSRTITNTGPLYKSALNPYTHPDGHWSCALNGANSDYFDVTNTADFAFGSGAFTIEFWVKAPPNNDKFFMGGRNGIGGGFHLTTGGYGGTTEGAVRLVTNAGTITTGTTSVCDMTWHHVAIVRSGTTVTIYVDGVSAGSGTDGTFFNTTSGTLQFFKNDLAAANYFTGQIADFRIVKGTAVYTSSFTPPLSPLTEISGTACLFFSCNRHRDRSSKDQVMTMYNWPAARPESPYATPQQYGRNIASFKCLDNYRLSINNQITVGTDDFCLEFWVYPAGSSDDAMFESRSYNNSGTGFTITLFGNNSIRLWSNASLIANTNTFKINNQWNHVAISRDSGTITFYWNGVSQGTTTSLSNWSDNTYLEFGDSRYYGSFEGLLCDMRLVTDDSVYSADFTPPTAPLAAIPGTQLLINGSDINVWDDAVQSTLIPYDGASSSTTQKKFGASSLHFDGTSDHILAHDSSALKLHNGDFTIECWVYFDVVYSAGTRGNGVFQYDDDATLNSFGWPFMAADGNGRWQMGYAQTNVSHGSEGPTADTWYHMALVRYNGTIKLYIDGVEKLSQSDTTDYARVYMMIGGYASNADRLNGYIDDFRVTKGVARYTGNFTPSTLPAPTF